MVQYARADTHYLLYIYDCMRAQLLNFNHGQPGLLQCVWNKSKDISLKVSTNLTSYILKIKLTLKINLYTPVSLPASFIALIFLHFHTTISCMTFVPMCLPSVQKYMKPIYTEESYLELQRKQKRSFNTQQLAAFRLLFAWRDKLARQEDESTG